MENLAEFLLAVIILCLSPGPDTLLVTRTSLKQGFKAGAAAAFGVSISSGVSGLLAAIGLAALLAHSKTAFYIIKTCGALYLGFLGLQTLYVAFFKQTSSGQFLADEQNNFLQNTSYASKTSFIKGFLTDFLDPLSGAFILSFFPRFVPKNAENSHYFFILAFLYFLGVFIFYMPLAFITSKATRLLSNPKILKSIDIISGILFIYLSISLIINEHFHS